MIDLQKEYHITRVVVMGNKDQTQWSESYSMKYSHNKTLVNTSSEIQVYLQNTGICAKYRFILSSEIEVYIQKEYHITRVVVVGDKDQTK